MKISPLPHGHRPASARQPSSHAVLRSQPKPAATAKPAKAEKTAKPETAAKPEAAAAPKEVNKTTAAVEESDTPGSTQQKRDCDAKWDQHKTASGAHGWHDYFKFMAGCI